MKIIEFLFFQNEKRFPLHLQVTVSLVVVAWSGHTYALAHFFFVAEGNHTSELVPFEPVLSGS